MIFFCQAGMHSGYSLGGETDLSGRDLSKKGKQWSKMDRDIDEEFGGSTTTSIVLSPLASVKGYGEESRRLGVFFMGRVDSKSYP